MSYLSKLGNDLLRALADIGHPENVRSDTVFNKAKTILHYYIVKILAHLPTVVIGVLIVKYLL